MPIALRLLLVAVAGASVLTARVMDQRLLGAAPRQAVATPPRQPCTAQLPYASWMAPTPAPHAQRPQTTTSRFATQPL